MAAFWEGDRVVAPRGGTPQPVFTAPGDPREVRQEGRDIAAEERAQRGEVQGLEDSTFRRASTLRTEFLGLPDVKQFRSVRAATQQIVTLAGREGSAMGDLGLIFSYMKALDPDSAVREGEQANAQNAAGVPDQIRNAYNKMLSGERLSPEQRQDMASTAQSIVQSRAAGYNEVAGIYRGLLEAQGLDPDEHGVTMFDPGAEAGREGSVPNAEVVRRPIPGLREPTREQVFSGGVQWGDQSGEMQDSVASYLERQYNVGPGLEAETNAMWNANVGNPDLTVEGVLDWYALRGLNVNEADVADKVALARKGGVEFTGSGAEAAIAEYYEQLDQVLEQRGADPESLSGAVGINAAQGVFPLLDEAAGVGGAINAAIEGQNPLAGYQAERDVLRREQSRAQEARPDVSTTAQIGGSLATGGAGFQTPARLARAAATARRIGDVGRAAQLARLGVGSAAKAGAGVGAFYGFSEGEGALDSTTGAAIGAGAGAAAGAAIEVAAPWISKAVKRAMPTRAPSQSADEGREVVEAADRLNERFGTKIRPLPADTGGPGIRNLSAGVGRLPIGAALIGRGAQKLTAEAEKASDAISALAGTSQSVEMAGDTALQGAQKYIKSSRTKVNHLYERARNLGGDTDVTLANAREALSRNIMELADTPGGARGLEALRELDVSMRTKTWTVEGVKRMRTQLRDRFMSDGLTGSDLERRVGQIVDAADDDVTDSLLAAGKQDAAAAYRSASDAHRERLQVINTVLAPIIGRQADNPRSGEEIIRAIEAAAERRSAKLGKFMSVLPAEDAAHLRATLIDRIGRATKGQQNADGDAFSLSSFLTRWGSMTDRAKGSLFGGELRSALDDLARVAEARKFAGRAVNPSGPGIGVVASSAAAAGGIAVSPWFLTLSVIDAVGGAALAWPGFARWLARMPSKPNLARQHVKSLSRVAASNTVIGGEVRELERRLLEQLEQGALPIAAQEGSADADSRETAGAVR